MVTSVSNNSSALLALQNLNRTNDQLSDTQSQISSTLAVAQPKDNPSVWATAQGQQNDITGLAAVTSSLNRATSISDIALSAGQSVSNLLSEMQQKVLTAQDTSLQSSDLSALNTDFVGLLGQVTSMINSATFDGANLINGSSGGDLRFLANPDGNQSITLSAQNMSLGGSIITVGATQTISTASGAAAAMAAIEASISNVTAALTDIGSQAKSIQAHSTFVDQLSQVLQTGMGGLVNADMAADDARLAALQVQQQIGQQSLSIANNTPQILLSLFR